MFEYTMKNIAKVVNRKEYRHIAICTPVVYYDKVRIERDRRDFYVTDVAWDIIKERYKEKYGGHESYSVFEEIDENNVIIFVEVENKDDDKDKKKK